MKRGEGILSYFESLASCKFVCVGPVWACWACWAFLPITLNPCSRYEELGLLLLHRDIRNTKRICACRGTFHGTLAHTVHTNILNASIPTNVEVPWHVQHGRWSGMESKVLDFLKIRLAYTYSVLLCTYYWLDWRPLKRKLTMGSRRLCRRLNLTMVFGTMPGRRSAVRYSSYGQAWERIAAWWTCSGFGLT